MLVTALIILERPLLPRRIIMVVMVLEYFLFRWERLSRSHRRSRCVIEQIARAASGLLQVMHCVTICIHLDLLTKNVREHL